MSRFHYSDDEMDINKVLKMNQDISTSMIEDTNLKATRSKADNNVDSSLKLLRSLGMDKEIQKLSSDISEKSNNRHLVHHPKTETWEDIVAQANAYEPNPVFLEDIMTESEIQCTFDERDEINEQFSKKTCIVNKIDLSFLAVATAIQTTKTLLFPYIADKFEYGKSFDQSERLNHNDKSIEKAHRNANDKFKDKNIEKHGTGHWINILYQTVPYDITKGSNNLGINMGGKYHRMYTLGHDPILGWLFGTANILTDCITFNDFHTNRISRIDSITGAKKMVITPQVVFMGQMFKECYEDIRADYLNLPAALFAQAQHLKSDAYTKLGLPVPLLSSFNEEFASKLYRENYDALCFARDIKIVGVSFVVSKIFDLIITLAHGLFKNKEDDKNLYDVRTRKILLISNSIASTSTIINSVITDNPKNLDIGSLLNTICHLFSDFRFITKIKEEFIENEISNKLMKEIAEIDSIYDRI